MKTIWKFPINYAYVFELRISANYRVVHVGLDSKGGPCFWAEVEDVNKLKETSETHPQDVQRAFFHVVGTGCPVPEGKKHLGTWLEGSYVFHLYGNSL